MTPQREPDADAIDGAWFRRVLGQYPTGVCVVTGTSKGGAAIAMVVGSFTSVSMDPPLVAFLPARSSSTWKDLRDCHQLCINVLAANQEKLCRKIASKDPDRFEGLDLTSGSNGAPKLPETLAAIECEVESIMEAGDHDIVLCHVTSLELGSGGTPLIFFRGGYGRFAAASIVAADPIGAIGAQIRLAQSMRPVLESGAAEFDVSCLLTTRLDNEIIVLAEAQAPHSKGRAAALVGQRLPYMPPTGAVFAAWVGEKQRDEWLKRLSDNDMRADMLAKLARVRERGASLGLISEPHRAFMSDLADAAGSFQEGPERFEKRVAQLTYDPNGDLTTFWQDVRQISVPIEPVAAKTPVALTIHSWPPVKDAEGVDRLIQLARDLAKRLSEKMTVNDIAP